MRRNRVVCLRCGHFCWQLGIASAIAENELKESSVTPARSFRWLAQTSQLVSLQSLYSSPGLHVMLHTNKGHLARLSIFNYTTPGCAWAVQSKLGWTVDCMPKCDLNAILTAWLRSAELIRFVGQIWIGSRMHVVIQPRLLGQPLRDLDGLWHRELRKYAPCIAETRILVGCWLVQGQDDCFDAQKGNQGSCV